MKINMIKQVDGGMIPADEESYIKYAKVDLGQVYKCDITLNQNYKLHKKIFGFFAFCTQHYYGDHEAHKDNFQLEYVREKLTIIAGYRRQVFDRNGGFELRARSLSYESMTPEERGDFYKKVTQAALDRVFDRTTDENIINQLVSWF